MKGGGELGKGREKEGERETKIGKVRRKKRRRDIIRIWIIKKAKRSDRQARITGRGGTE